MNLFERLTALGARAAEQGAHLQTEEATKNALVMPFINALGYNVFDPLEVVPEFTADVGIKRGEKVDYAVMREGRPILLVEAKAITVDLDRAVMSQLFRYFSVTDAKVALSTNGIRYHFFSNLDTPNRMDQEPFLELDLADLRSNVVERLQHLTKDDFDEDRLLETAGELKYRGQVKKWLAKQLADPGDELVRLVASQVASGRLTKAVRELFGRITREAFSELVKDRVRDRLRAALSRAGSEDVAGAASLDEGAEASDSEESEINTTAEELQGFYIVKGVLRRIVAADRVAHRDVRSYFGILLDDNNRKPLARLHFNGRQKFLGLFDNPDKKEERVALSSLDEIYDYAERLRSTVGYYEQDPGVRPSTRGGHGDPHGDEEAT